VRVGVFARSLPAVDLSDAVLLRLSVRDRDGDFDEDTHGSSER